MRSGFGSSTRARAVPFENGVKCLAVGRAFDRVIIATYVFKSDGAHAAQQLHSVIARVLASSAAVDQHPRLTVTDRQVGTLHYDTERGFVFFCVTTNDYPQRIAFKCIAAFKAEFIKQFGDIAEKSAEGGVSKPARGLMAEMCSTYADPASFERAIGINRQVLEVTEIMSGSINEMLATQDDLQVLEDKTDSLASQALNFQRSARSLKRNQWWKNCKLKLAMCTVVLFVLGVICVPLILQAMAAVNSGTTIVVDGNKPAAPTSPPPAPPTTPV